MTLSSQRPSLIHCRNNAGCVFFADQVPEPYSPVDRKGWHSQTIWVMRISINGGTPSSLDGLFHGKSKSKMDDLVIPPHLGNLHIYIYIHISYIKHGRWASKLWPAKIKNMLGQDNVSYEFIWVIWGWVKSPMKWFHTMWGPPVISWFISLSNYSYKYHKP